MRAVIQVVSNASVKVGPEVISRITKGYLVLLAIHIDDTEDKIIKLADKIEGLRIFTDENDKLNLNLKDVQGEIMVVSQFTLYGETKKGNRPGFTLSAHPDKAIPYYEKFVSLLKDKGFKVLTGQFGAKMSVSLINEGPTTIIIDL